MPGTLMRAAMRPLALAQIRHVEPVKPGTGDALVDRVYQQVEREFGVLAPPVALHSPAPEATAAAWLILRETLLVPGDVDRSVKEAVACGVSLANTCPFCVTVHSATLHGLAGGRDARAISAGRLDTVRDPKIRAAVRWASSPGTEPLDHLTPQQRAEYLGVAATFHYLNRMVNTFLTEAPMPQSAPRQGLAAVKRVLSAMIRAAGRHVGGPGESLDLLPAAELPADLAWAAGSQPVGQAFARAAAALDRAAERSVPRPVRELVATELAGQSVRERGPSRAWVEKAVAPMPAVHRPAARLALLVALASFMVDGQIIDEFRQDRPDDTALVETAAWAAMTAARRSIQHTASS